MNISYVDVCNSKKVLSYCSYYDDIINFDIDYDDELSFDLIDWYKDYIFSCDCNNEDDIKNIKEIDKCMYMYISSYSYRSGLKKIIDVNDIDLNSNKKNKKLIRKIINYNNEYEDNKLFNYKISRWI